ncbi:hypothetical protein FRC10_001600 [Ceratobasidium sp. 414]|nr:hypothetical protein FRC10_001600 [Ceratobasidium sp. 414]
MPAHPVGESQSHDKQDLLHFSPCAGDLHPPTRREFQTFEGTLLTGSSRDVGSLIKTHTLGPEFRILCVEFLCFDLTAMDPTHRPPPVPATRPPGISSHNLVFYIDMALVGVLGVITLAYLPRTVARYVHKSSRREGWLLRRARVSSTPARSLQNNDLLVSNSRGLQYPPDRFISVSAGALASHSAPSSTISRPQKDSAPTPGAHPPPPHFRPYTSYIPTLGRILDYHILGLTIHQLIVLGAYILITAIALFYRSNPTTNASRAGYVVMSQMPIVFALGTKNSVVSLLAGISYEKVWKHQPQVAVPYVATCIALYSIDQLACIVKTRLRKATLTPLPELGSTRVQILGVKKGWAAGQHVRLRVLSFGVGWLGWTEAHPFTIANAASNSPDELTLICKIAGDWTSGLYKMASGGSKGDHRAAYVLVDGPYGGPGNTMFTSFSGVMLVLGGSGITFGTSVLEDIVAKSIRGDSPASVSFLSSFTELVQRATIVPDLQLSISVFYTRGSGEPFVLPANLPSNIQIQSGRPDFRKELDQLISSTQVSIDAGSSSRNGVIMAGCGPKSLIASVFATKTGTSDESQKAVGGLELHTEYVYKFYACRT